MPCFWQGRSSCVPTTLKLNSPAVPGAFYPPCSLEYQYKQICTEILSCPSTGQGLLVLLCKAQERGALQGLPQPSSSSSFPPTPPTDHKPSSGSWWNLRAPCISNPRVTEFGKDLQDPHLTTTSMGPSCCIPTHSPPSPPVCEGTGLHWPNPKVFSHSPLFPSSFCMTHALSQSIFPELS